MPSLSDRFTEGVFDYISLLDLDYGSIFMCECGDKCQDFDNVSIIYDNSCKLLRSLMLRYPALGESIMCVIDALHQSGHVDCSPLFNHKLSVAVQKFNAALNEQKNRILNYTKTSAAHMGQIRVMVYIRYHLADLNRAQHAVNQLRRSDNHTVQWMPSPNKGVVTDGVGVCFKQQYMRMVREHEVPHDLAALQSAGQIKPSTLVVGCDMNKCLMINNAKSRKTLAQLVIHSVAQDDWNELQTWLRANRPELLPYILVDVKSGSVFLRHECHDIRRVLQHFSAPDPEIKLIPQILMDSMKVIVSSKGKLPDARGMEKINTYGDGVYALFKHDAKQHPAERSAGMISEAMLKLLTISCSLVEACKASDDTAQPVGKFWYSSLPPFEEMVRSGAFAGNDHPIIRSLPFFRQDYLLLQAARRTGQKKDAAKVEAMKELSDQTLLLGATCHKYKTRYRALTPGLFTVFCAGCGMCEAFEMMPCAESPLTAFRMFAHRAWTPKHLAMWKTARTEPMP
jgi:hypothetical protein